MKYKQVNKATHRLKRNVFRLFISTVATGASNCVAVFHLRRENSFYNTKIMMLPRCKHRPCLPQSRGFRYEANWPTAEAGTRLSSLFLTSLGKPIKLVAYERVIVDPWNNHPSIQTSILCPRLNVLFPTLILRIILSVTDFCRLYVMFFFFCTGCYSVAACNFGEP